MKTLNINIDEGVINKIYRPYLTENRRLQIFFGGSSSGKSVFLAQRCVLDMIKGDRNYLIIRNVAKTMRHSVFNEIKSAITRFKLNEYFNINKSDMVITCTLNNRQILFSGLDDPLKVHGIKPQLGVITDIWIEEAWEVSKSGVKELTKRLRGLARVDKRIIFSFNPIMRTHWTYKDFFKGKFADDDVVYKDENVSILRTTYKDNAFLMPDDIKALENEKDRYYYEVYTLGHWGTLGNVIFKNWRIEDLTNIKEHFNLYRHGLDFGYSNDPTAYIRSALDRKKSTLYIVEGYYMTVIKDECKSYELTNPEIAERLIKEVGSDIIRCDSQEPKSIEELRQNGLTGATAAVKGKGSVLFGIQWLKQWEIVIDQTLQDIINEFQLYQWRTDKNDEPINEPIDKDNHCIDGCRYSWSDILMGEQDKDDTEYTKDEYGFF